MKKNILSMAALLIASATFVACSSDDNIIDETQQPANGKYTMTIEASKGGEADSRTTRALSLDGKTLNATWDAGEIVEVYQSGSKIGELTAASSTDASTTLTGSFENAPSTSADLTFYFHTNATPSYSGQDGTLETIASTFDFYAPATVTTGNFAVDDVNKKITVPGGISFGANQQAIVKFTLKDKATNEAISTTELVVSDGTNTYTITPASATSEIFVAIPGFSGQTVTINATINDVPYTFTKSSVTFANGQYYAITVSLAPVGAVRGGFTVNNSGNKVYFSKGNLQATTTDKGTNWTWAFAANQWDYIGNAAGNTKVTASSPFISENATVDLFGWVGASSTWTGVNKYGITSSSATSNTNGYGNVASESLKSDWGALIGKGWRTLTMDEWTYLFNERSASTVGGTADGRYAKAKINNKTGMILFPDTYTHPDGVTAPTNVNTASASFGSNTYTVADWTKMESAGCVFLPAAGWRNGTTINNPNDRGFYWSTTPSNATAAKRLYFSAGLDLTGDNSRAFGFSVRLVREVE